MGNEMVDERIDEIRRRHERANEDAGWEWTPSGFMAHKDRATLLADPSKYEWWCYECEKFVPSSEVCLAVHTGPNGCQGDCTPLPEAPSNKKDLRIRELEQRLAAVEGLPRYTHTTFCGAVPDSTGRWIKRDDLLAALRPQQQED